MTVDISKIKVGDEVELGGRFKVRDISFASEYFPIAINLTDVLSSEWISPYMIAAHHPAPRPFKVGDWVRATDPIRWIRITYKIKAIIDDRAWISSRVYGDRVVQLSDLRPAD